jgi:uncharacterized protein YuzE
MQTFKCVSSFWYNQAYWIYKYLNSRNIPYKFDCTIHSDDGFQLLVPQEYILKVRNDLWYIERMLLELKEEMKLLIDNQVDALYLKFNDNKVAKTIQLQREINVDIDVNNKVVRIEVLHYSKTKYRANEILEDTAYLSLDEDSIVFYINNGIYATAWFNL